MEKFLGEVFGAFILSGAFGVYAFIIVILLVIFYFKYMKPFLGDFEDIKSFLGSLPEVHDDYNTKLEEIVELMSETHKEDIIYRERKIRELVAENNKAHNAIGNEFSKMKYLIEELSRKDEKFFDKNNEAFSKIILELTKLETRLEYQNGPVLGGIRK